MVLKKSNKKAKDENEKEDLEEDFADPEGETVALKVANFEEVSKETFQCKTMNKRKLSPG